MPRVFEQPAFQRPPAAAPRAQYTGAVRLSATNATYAVSAFARCGKDDTAGRINGLGTHNSGLPC